MDLCNIPGSIHDSDPNILLELALCANGKVFFGKVDLIISRDKVEVIEMGKEDRFF